MREMLLFPLNRWKHRGSYGVIQPRPACELGRDLDHHVLHKKLVEVFPLVDSAVTRTSMGVGGSMTRWGVLWSRKEMTLEMSPGARGQTG